MIGRPTVNYLVAVIEYELHAPQGRLKCKRYDFMSSAVSRS